MGRHGQAGGVSQGPVLVRCFVFVWLGRVLFQGNVGKRPQHHNIYRLFLIPFTYRGAHKYVFLLGPFERTFVLDVVFVLCFFRERAS